MMQSTKEQIELIRDAAITRSRRADDNSNYYAEDKWRRVSQDCSDLLRSIDEAVKAELGL